MISPRSLHVILCSGLVACPCVRYEELTLLQFYALFRVRCVRLRNIFALVTERGMVFVSSFFRARPAAAGWR